MTHTITKAAAFCLEPRVEKVLADIMERRKQMSPSRLPRIPDTVADDILSWAENDMMENRYE